MTLFVARPPLCSGYCKYNHSCRYQHPQDKFNTEVRPRPPPRFAEGDVRYEPEHAQAVPIARALQFQLQNAAARERARDEQIHRLEAQVQSLNNTLSMQSQIHSQALAHGRFAVNVVPVQLIPATFASSPAIAAARSKRQRRRTKKKQAALARQGVADAAAQADREAAAKDKDGDDAIKSDEDAEQMPARAYIRAKRKNQPAMAKHKPPRGAAAAAASSSAAAATAAGARAISPVAAAAASMSSLRVRTKLGGVSGQKRAHETNTNADNEVATHVEIFSGTPAHLAGLGSATGARRLPPIPTHNAFGAGAGGQMAPRSRMQMEADGSDEEGYVKTEASAGEESLPDAPARSTRSTRSMTQAKR